MNKTIIREIRIYPCDDDYPVKKIVINNEQFLSLKKVLEHSGDPDLAYVYPLALEICNKANVFIPEKFSTDKFEFYLHTYAL